MGAVLVNPTANAVIGTGFNGPPAGTPHCNEEERRETLMAAAKGSSGNADLIDEVERLSLFGRKDCPRRKGLGFGSGEGLAFCVAAHAERNAILNAAKVGAATLDSTLYCYCGIPCAVCAIDIINAGVKRVVHLYCEKYYDGVAVILFDQADVELDWYTVETVLWRSQRILSTAGQTRVKCDNCGRTYDEDSEYIIPLEKVEDLEKRLDPGGPYPAGECRECGAFVYLISEPKD